MKNRSVSIGLLFYLLIGVVPFAAALVYALLYSVGLAGALSQGFTLRFWQAVLENGEFVRSFGYSTLVAAAALLCSVSAALWLTLHFRQAFERRWLSLVIYLPLAIPGVVAAFFTFQLFSKAGFFARIAYHLGWIAEARQFPDLVNDQWAIGIILTFVTVVTPFFLLLFLNVYKNERIDALADLSYSLGATPRQIIWRVSLPVLLRKTRVLIALYFIFLLGSYEIPLILGQESPQMLSVLIIREIKQYDLEKIPEGYVVAVIYTIAVSIAAVLLFLRKSDAAHES